MYDDNEKKFVAILNKKIPLPQLMNALGHMTIGLASRIQGFPEEANFLEYRDASGGSHPSVSRYPFIVLSAKNSNQLRNCREAALLHNLPCTDFTHTMLGSSAEDQLQRTAATSEDELEYFGVCLFGDSKDIDPLTKKFSLFKSSQESVTST